MKKLFFLFVIVFTGQILISQDCSSGFYPSKEGTKMSYSNFDDKGNLLSTNEQKIKSFKNTSSGFEAQIEASSYDKKGKPVVESGSFTVKCDNGVLKMQLHQLYVNQMQAIKNMELEVSGEGMQIPYNLEVGKTLPDALTEVKLKTSNMTLMTMKFDVKNQVVEKMEKITTPAGTFDCYKIVQETEMKVLFKRTFKSAMWFAKGVGMVRNESYNKKGEIEGYMVLSKLEK